MFRSQRLPYRCGLQARRRTERIPPRALSLRALRMRVFFTHLVELGFDDRLVFGRAPSALGIGQAALDPAVALVQALFHGPGEFTDLIANARELVRLTLFGLRYPVFCIAQRVAHVLRVAAPRHGVNLAREVSGWQEEELDEVLDYLLHSTNVWTEMATIWAAYSLKLEGLVDAVVGELAVEASEIVEEIKSKRGDGAMAEDQPLTTMEKITFLKESPFFAALPLEELYHIALSMEEEGAREGTPVIKEGTMGDKMYIVVSGELEVKKEGGPRFAVVGESQVFGEQALLDEEPRSASVVALGEVHLLSLQRSSLERILRRYSSIAFNMMRILSQRLREAQAHS